MSTFQVLSKRIGASRGALTKSFDKFNQIRSAQPLDQSEIRAIQATINTQNERLEKLCLDYEALFSEDDMEKLEEHLTKAEEYRAAVSQHLSLCETCMTENAHSSGKDDFSLRLPKVTLPSFSGDVLDWQEFFETFSITVDNRSITDVEKMQYLKLCLKGEASRILIGLPLTNKNYSIAIDLLQKRYGSTRRILRSHVQALLSLSLPSMKSSSSLREFVDNVNKHMRGLETLDVVSGNYDIILCELLLSKLPGEIRRSWSKLDDEEMILENLLSIIEKEAKLIDNLAIHSSLQMDKMNNSRVTSSPIKRNNHSVNLLASNQGCVFCRRSDHQSFQCKPFLAQQPFERREMVRKSNLCFNCLKPHKLKDCNSTSRCKICQQNHNTLLHFEARSSSVPNVENNTNVKISRISTKHKTVLPTITIPIKTKYGIKNLGALLDSGSDRSFISSAALDDIEYQVLGLESISIQAFTGPAMTEKCKFIRVSSEFNGASETMDLLVTKQMKRFSNSHIDLSSIPDLFVNCSKGPSTIEIIIGADLFYDFVTGAIQHIDSKAKLIETKYGWTPHGIFKNISSNSSTSVLFTSCVTVGDDLDIKLFWDNENAGIYPPAINEDTDILKNFNDSIILRDLRYAVNLPWLADRTLTSTYKQRAYARLQQTTKKLIKSDKLAAYNEIIQEYLEMDIIEVCNENSSNIRCRYVPHHAVIKEQAQSTKIRIVFDASAREIGENSINDCLFEGPNLFPNLMGVLFRFRIFEFALSGDIQKAFLQIEVKKEDRDFMRFMWWSSVKEKNYSQEVTSYRFKRVPFGFRSSPFILNQVIKTHLNTAREAHKEIVEAIEDNIYVDDLVVSVESKHQLHDMMKKIPSIFSEMSMCMHKWRSNLPMDCADDSVSEGRILGLLWNSDEDCLQIQFPIVSNVRTKRQLASILCSCFDPLGFFIPVTNKMKLLLQECWHENLNWDDEISSSMQSDLQDVVQSFSILNNHQIVRYFNFSSACSNVKLLSFSDASKSIYSACVYFSFEHNGQSQSHLICSKSRVAPKRGNTIPRLELLGALLSARLVQTISKQLPASIQFSVQCFVDSQIVLCWINNSHKAYKQFVQNRLIEIRKAVPPSNWFYVNTHNNPADIATKSCSANFLVSSQLWWHGPENLQDHPVDNLSHDEEICHQIVVRQETPIIDFTRFSNYFRLLRTIMYVLKFCKVSSDHFNRELCENISIKIAQRESFAQEISHLRNKGSVDKTSQIALLHPFLDEHGILRVGGRLQNSALKYNAKHPAILHDKHHLTMLIIRYTHISNAHTGVSTLCCLLRQQFWVLKCRRTCKVLLNRCVICKRHNSRQCHQHFDQLPSDRVQMHDMRPFQFTGCDYMGPITILSNNLKVYVLLLTCIQTRAIHLELTTSLNSKDFTNALFRFISRRGVPSKMRSDNGKTFVAAAQKLQQFKNITWQFNVPKAPWTGGIWERLVKTVKLSLRKSFHRIPSNILDLETLLFQIEHIINSRPISYCHGNEEQLIPLCPNNFLTPSSNIQASDAIPLSHDEMYRSLQGKQKTIENFWTRWKREYLSLLNTNTIKSSKSHIKVNDILLLEEGSKRQYWPLVRVVELLPGRDNKVRSVKINLRQKIVTRPVKLLHHLELSD